MRLSPDSLILWQQGFIQLNGTIVFTWLVMALLVVGSWLVSRTLNHDGPPSRWQNLLETVLVLILDQVREVTRRTPERFFPFLATLFLFVAASNLLTVMPGFESPTGSLSTTAALALCVLLSVPLYGATANGLASYLANYLQPTPLMLPFNVIGEVSRTVALAVRLFGNVMSGSMIGAILLAIAPLLVPVIMQLFGLLTGMVQAYIFFILAAVYLGAGIEVQTSRTARQ